MTMARSSDHGDHPITRDHPISQNATIQLVLKPALMKPMTIAILLAVAAAAQQEPTQQPTGKPQVKVNMLNVCSPAAEEQAVIKGALSKVPSKPSFSQDFEISRGRTTLQDAPEARFVRLRRDFPPESP